MQYSLRFYVMRARKFERYDCDYNCRMSSQAGALSVTITNISQGGFLGSSISPAALSPGGAARVTSDQIGSMAVVVRWVGMNDFGAEFSEPISDEQVRKFVQGRRGF